MTDQEASEQLSALKARFAYMFNGGNIGFDFYKGWLPDFIEACEQIDPLLGADKRGFHFRQAKEKHGWSRYYFKTDEASPKRLSIQGGRGVYETTLGIDDKPVEQEIAKILSAAERKSMHKCVNCGCPAEIRQVHAMMLCVCDEHAYEERGESIRRALVND